VTTTALDSQPGGYAEGHTTAPADRIPLGQKVAYGVGMLGNQLFTAALGVFMVVLVQGLGFSPFLWSLLFFAPRLVDAVTDPIMGFVTDNTRSRWGRRRPWILVGAIVTGLSYVGMWQLYETNSITFNFTWFLLFSFVFYVGLTVFQTPYVAMGYEMSRDFHERTRVMAVAQWIGQWSWVIVPWFWPLMYDPTLFETPALAVRELSVWVGLGCMAMALVPAFFVDSPSTAKATHLKPLDRAHVAENVKTFVAGFGEAFRCLPFRKLCAATFLVFNAYNVVAAFGFFIIVYHLFGGDADAAGSWTAWFGTASALCTTFLVIPVVTWMSQRFGKKNAFLLSQGISLLGYVGFWFTFRPGEPRLMLLPLPLFAFGIGGLFTLMTSMTADVCDLDELATGERREGTFAAIYWWMVKFGLAFAGGLSGLIMGFVGFVPDAPTQPEGAVTGLRIAFSVVPASGAILAMWFMRNYDLSEARAFEIRTELEARRGVSALT
jgi:GPH family glycoside/pentoside/hexuronide:cation symporter